MIDLTPFDFTQTESLVYEVLVTHGPGTGYAVARAAGLARANAYSALEGLVAKGAARSEGIRPKRYRPEPAPLLLGRIADQQGRAIDELAQALGRVSLPSSPSVSEIGNLRGAVQLLTLEIARAQVRVDLAAPPETYPSLGPSIRRAAMAGVELHLWSDGEVQSDAATVRALGAVGDWPGRPLLAAIDQRTALIGLVEGDRTGGHWSTAPALVAAARYAIGALAGGYRPDQ